MLRSTRHDNGCTLTALAHLFPKQAILSGHLYERQKSVSTCIIHHLPVFVTRMQTQLLHLLVDERYFSYKRASETKLPTY